MKKSQLTIERNSNFLYFTITGEYDKKEIMTYPQIIADACKNEGIHKVLVNALMLKGTNAPTMDRFFLGQAVAALLGPKIKLAVAWPKEHINKFAETVAVNRGSWINVVSDVDTAQKWLLKDP